MVVRALVGLPTWRNPWLFRNLLVVALRFKIPRVSLIQAPKLFENSVLPIRTMSSKIAKSEEEWRNLLTPSEYNVLREKGTEPPGSGEYDEFSPATGYFACKACGNPLYTAAAKFHSGCGWPSFDKCIKGSLMTHEDTSFGMKRIEIVCARCDSHLGHVFEGENFTETNERHCVNSLSVKYHKETLPNSYDEIRVLASKM